MSLASSPRQRIVAALAANGFGQAVTLGSQLLLTPLFFAQWGAGLYGDWLILSAIPAYLMLADLGVSSAAGNEMAMRAGAGDRAGAQQAFRAALAMGALAALVALLLGAGAAALAASVPWPALPHIAPPQAAGLLCLLSTQVALGFAGSVVQAGFRCGGLNGLGTTWANLARLAEALASAWVLLAQGSPLLLGGAVLAVRALMLAWQWALLRTRCPWLWHPRAPAQPGLLRRLLRPSLGFMAFPLAYALALQGPVLLVGHLFGSPAVAVFVAMRTLARLPVQITNVINNALAPEVSLAHGEGRTDRLRHLHRRAWATTTAGGALASLAIGLGGPWLTTLWLGPGHHQATVLGLLLAVSWVSAVWNVSSILLTATNRHLALGIGLVVANLAGLGLAAVLGPWHGLPAVLLALLAVELAMLAGVLPAALRLSGDTPRAFFAKALSRPSPH